MHEAQPENPAPSLFHQKCRNVNPILSTACELCKKEYFSNALSLNSLRTLLQNTGGYPSNASFRPTTSLFFHSW
jgi:hypothetical protein